MNAIYILIAIVSLIFLLNCATSKKKEGFRGRGFRGRRGYFWDGPQEYLYRFRRRRPYPRRYFWDYDWDYDYDYDYSFNWWPPINAFWGVPLQCKRGCTPNGCATPGTGPEDCVWSSDCNGC